MQLAKLIVHLVKQLHCAHVVLSYQECVHGWVGGFLLRFLGMMSLHLTDTFTSNIFTSDVHSIRMHVAIFT